MHLYGRLLVVALATLLIVNDVAAAARVFPEIDVENWRFSWKTANMDFFGVAKKNFTLYVSDTRAPGRRVLTFVRKMVPFLRTDRRPVGLPEWSVEGEHLSVSQDSRCTHDWPKRFTTSCELKFDVLPALAIELAGYGFEASQVPTRISMDIDVKPRKGHWIRSNILCGPYVPCVFREGRGWTCPCGGFEFGGLRTGELKA
ncbi:MAG: hypothetical protein M1833_005327 [Piccolia ochrophora]|nr:MAG: hypothetical protein M1833_005327 [Piccolia ochrophora]